MKDAKRDFDRGENRMDETKVMGRPEDAGDTGADRDDGRPKVRVRPKDKAARDILAAVEACGEDITGDVAGAVTSSVDALYDAYGADGTVPTREAFAERCASAAIGRVVLAMPENPFVRKALSRKAVAAICAGCVAAVALVGCGVAFALGSGGGTPDVPAQPTVASATGTEAEESFALPIGVVAEGWDALTSSPVIVHVVSEAEGIDYYHAFSANEDARLAVPSGGEYEVSFISPVNSDGSIYRVPDAVTVAAVAEGDEATDADLPFEFERVPAEDVTADELTDIMGQVTEAIKKGDETLTGEAGAEVAGKVEENCNANPNADREAVEEESSEATEAAEQESEAQTGGTASTGGNSGSSPSSGGSSTGSKPSSGNTGSSKPSTGSSGSGGSTTGGSSQSKPSHTHNWVPVTTTVHHDAEYKTVHHDAEYKTVHHDAVVEYRDICNNCGADITGNIDAHFKANILNGCGSFTSKPVTVQAAYDENILVKAAWDEQVLVKAAWDETVTTGYKCSTCGATK